MKDFIALLAIFILIYILCEVTMRLLASKKENKELRIKHEEYLDSLTPEKLMMHKMGQRVARAMFYGNENKERKEFFGLRSFLNDQKEK